MDFGSINPVLLIASLMTFDVGAKAAGEAF